MAAIRANAATNKMLKELAAATGLPMRAVLERAVDSYWRTLMLERLNTDYAALRDNPVAWEEELAERALWEQTLGDGLTR